jgi:Zn-dependent M28 family amino/carboxypeptidase
MMQQINAMMDVPNGAWTAQQIAIMAKLRDAALADPYAMNELQHLTENIGPRLSGSPQARKAVDYVAAEMRSLGAEVTLEKTKVPHWVRGAETGELTAWPGMAPSTTQKIVLTALGGSVATPVDGLTAEVVVVNSFDDLKGLAPDALKGKILLFNEHFDKRLAAQGDGFHAYGQAVVYRMTAPMVGAAHGAVAALIRSVGGADFRLPHTGITMYDPQLPKIPAAAVTAEDADLLAHLTTQGTVRMKLVLTPQSNPPADSFNVIADWKGTEHPEQVVIVSGHLDSWDLGTGAIDDGAGVVVSMQAVHLLSQMGIHPKRTVRFVAWMSEEEGSQGAETYAQDHAADIPNHVAAIETDAGAGHPTGIYFAGKPALEAFLRPVAQTLRPIGASSLVSTPEAGEDIATVTSKGVPGFAPVQDSRFYFNYHHTPADTFDKVDAHELNENAALVTVLAYALADASEAAPR